MQSPENLTPFNQALSSSIKQDARHSAAGMLIWRFACRVCSVAGTGWVQQVRVWEAAELYWTGTKAARVVQSPVSRDFCSSVLGDSTTTGRRE